ncbi:MAG: glycosyltransferase [Actinomycetota bacterium]|nr:glycosyltransferase [Actinomycetota bacterium]
MISYCTIVKFDDLPFARVLADSLRRHHPDAELDVLVLDPLRRRAEPGEGMRFLAPHAVGVDDADRLVARLGHLGAAAVVRPRLVDALLEEGAESVASMVPWLDVCGPLTILGELVERHSPVLTLRLPEGLPPDDGRRPHRLDVLDAGWLSPAVVAVRGDDRGFTRWWTRELHQRAEAAPDTWRRHAYIRESALTAGLEDAPQRFTESGFVGDPGWAASAWNLHVRPLTLADGTVFAAGSRLRLLDFTGFRPDRPHLLVPVERDSTGGPDVARVHPPAHPLLIELCRSYAERLVGAGWIAPERPPSGPPELPRGVAYDTLVARLHELAAAEGEDVHDLEEPRAREALVAWVSQPAKRGGEAGVTRYLHALYETRADLQAAFPDLDGPDADAFARWAWEHGQVELDLPPALLPPGRAASIPAVRVVGHMRDGVGLGKAARLYVEALTAAGIPPGTRTIDIDPADEAGVDGGRARVPFGDSDAGGNHMIDLLCVNADLLASRAGLGVEDRADPRLMIAVWAWEVDVVRADWLAGLELIDEVWVYSRFVAANLASVSPVPVVPVPPPVVLAPATDRVQLPEGFTFLFMFDYLSTVARKNPAGVIEAFTRAFAPGEGPQLVLKSFNESLRPEDREALRERAGDRPDILFLESYISETDKSALLGDADCYVSLHRSEGFGLTLAESMLLGKPTIATAYSGNLDFMTVGNSYLVDWRPTLVGPDAEFYPSSGTWAEPDVAHAAVLMRRVWERQDEARAKGQRASQEIGLQLSPAAAGARAVARLRRVTDRSPFRARGRG